MFWKYSEIKALPICRLPIEPISRNVSEARMLHVAQVGMYIYHSNHQLSCHHFAIRVQTSATNPGLLSPFSRTDLPLPRRKDDSTRSTMLLPCYNTGISLYILYMIVDSLNFSFVVILNTNKRTKLIQRRRRRGESTSRRSPNYLRSTS